MRLSSLASSSQPGASPFGTRRLSKEHLQDGSGAQSGSVAKEIQEAIRLIKEKRTFIYKYSLRFDKSEFSEIERRRLKIIPISPVCDASEPLTNATEDIREYSKKSKEWVGIHQFYFTKEPLKPTKTEFRYLGPHFIATFGSGTFISLGFEY